MLEELLNVEIVAPLPLGTPVEAHTLQPLHDVGVDILKVQHVRAVLRDVLDVAGHVVLRPPPQLQRLQESPYVYHRVERL